MGGAWWLALCKEMGTVARNAKPRILLTGPPGTRQNRLPFCSESNFKMFTMLVLCNRVILFCYDVLKHSDLNMKELPQEQLDVFPKFK
jgi:hypothetical protein